MSQRCDEETRARLLPPCLRDPALETNVAAAVPAVAPAPPLLLFYTFLTTKKEATLGNAGRVPTRKTKAKWQRRWRQRRRLLQTRQLLIADRSRSKLVQRTRKTPPFLASPDELHQHQQRLPGPWQWSCFSAWRQRPIVQRTVAQRQYPRGADYREETMCEDAVARTSQESLDSSQPRVPSFFTSLASAQLWPTIAEFLRNLLTRDKTSVFGCLIGLRSSVLSSALSSWVRYVQAPVRLADVASRGERGSAGICEGAGKALFTVVVVMDRKGKSGPRWRGEPK